MGRLIREELDKCYYREGVNHLEKCGALRGMFGLPLATLVDWMHEAHVGVGGFEWIGC